MFKVIPNRGRGTSTSLMLTAISAVVISVLPCSQMAGAAEFHNVKAPITYKIDKPHTYSFLQSQPVATDSLPGPVASVTMPPAPDAPFIPKQQSAPHSPFDMRNNLAAKPGALSAELPDHIVVGQPYSVAGITYVPQHDPAYDETGLATWYGDKFHGKPTALGEICDKNALTAAHKTLPINSFVTVTNVNTGLSVKVRINDRGPFLDGNIIDLSEAAAAQIGMFETGPTQVRVQYAGLEDGGAISKPSQKPVQIAQNVAHPPFPQAYTPPPVAQPPMGMNTQMPQRAMPPAPNQMQTMPPQAQYQQQPYNNAPATGNMNFALPQVAPPVATSAAPPAIPTIGSTGHTEMEGMSTLTIKGPIHMARTEKSKDKAQLIRAYHDKK